MADYWFTTNGYWNELYWPQQFPYWPVVGITTVGLRGSIFANKRDVVTADTRGIVFADNRDIIEVR